mmetsp:Transcript_21904/g.58402  ORF Transcript_21904/g.58402 Transcript_21904/m.58402 type:complete len:226 (-) Transcript_21904:52-729(-)
MAKPMDDTGTPPDDVIALIGNIEHPNLCQWCRSRTRADIRPVTQGGARGRRKRRRRPRCFHHRRRHSRYNSARRGPVLRDQSQRGGRRGGDAAFADGSRGGRGGRQADPAAHGPPSGFAGAAASVGGAEGARGRAARRRGESRAGDGAGEGGGVWLRRDAEAVSCGAVQRVQLWAVLRAGYDQPRVLAKLLQVCAKEEEKGASWRRDNAREGLRNRRVPRHSRGH